MIAPTFPTVTSMDTMQHLGLGTKIGAPENSIFLLAVTIILVPFALLLRRCVKGILNALSFRGAHASGKYISSVHLTSSIVRIVDTHILNFNQAFYTIETQILECNTCKD